MYELVGVDIPKAKLGLTNKKFWVGVVEQIRPSPPVPRRKTRCYTAVPVYVYNGEYVFNMLERNRAGKMVETFYKIPSDEKEFME